MVLLGPTEHPSQTEGRSSPRAAPDDLLPPGLRALDPGAVSLWRIQYAARGAFIAAAVLSIELLTDSTLGPGILSGVVVAVTAAALLVMPPLQFRHWRFGLTEEHLRLFHGVVFRTTSIVPYARIQHVDTRHGPLDRWLGLATLVVFTAGTRGAILAIPALAAGDAEELRDRLIALSGTGDAV